MVHSTLIAADGGLVTEDDLRLIPAPPPSGRWYPISHSAVLERVKTTLSEAGYFIAKSELSVSRNGQRFFGTLDLTTPLVEGISLVVGVRNSTDKSFPIGFVGGSRVFVCANLCFSGELLVSRKHTKHGNTRFGEDISAAVVKLSQYRDLEGVLRIPSEALDEYVRGCTVDATGDRDVSSGRPVSVVIKSKHFKL